MIPLIDTFFLLLAFFISSVFTMEKVTGLPVQLPRALGAARIQKEDRLLVTVGGEGVLQLEGEPMSVEQLGSRLSAHPRRDSVQVGIRADRQTPYQWLIRVLEGVRGAGVGKVTLMTQPVGRKHANR
jgi:biopolymer transport protein ExbD